MMERRIIVYSSKSANVCSFILSLISLIPGSVFFGFSINSEVKSYDSALSQFGLPLHLFNNDTKIYPLFTLYDMDSLDPNKGYLIGTTNQIVFQSKKLNADLLINLDTGAFDVIEKSKSIWSDHFVSKHEKEISNKIANQLKSNIPDTEEDMGSSDSWMLSSSQFDANDDFIRNEFKTYFFNLLSDIALVSEILKSNDNLAILKDFSIKEDDAEDEDSSQSLDSIKALGGSLFEFADGKSLKLSLKKILSNYITDFLINWSGTNNFLRFITTYNNSVSYRSNFVKYASNVLIKFENGDIYQGEVSHGIRHGKGVLIESDKGIKYIYNGDFNHDKKHGMGTYTSEDNSYVYDGEFKEDKREGFAQLLFKSTKYSGHFVE